MSLLMSRLSISPDLPVIGCLDADGQEMEGNGWKSGDGEKQRWKYVGVRWVGGGGGWTPPPHHHFHCVTFLFRPQGRQTWNMSGVEHCEPVTRSWIRGGKWLKSSGKAADGGTCLDQLSQVAASFFSAPFGPPQLRKRGVLVCVCLNVSELNEDNLGNGSSGLRVTQTKWGSAVGCSWIKLSLGWSNIEWHPYML